MKKPTKLIVAIVQDQDVPILIDEIITAGFRVTKLATSGGFLKAGNTTLLMGIHEEEIPEVMQIIDDNCRTREVSTTMISSTVPGDGFLPYPVNVRIGGAIMFVLDIDDFIQI